MPGCVAVLPNRHAPRHLQRGMEACPAAAHAAPVDNKAPEGHSPCQIGDAAAAGTGMVDVLVQNCLSSRGLL